MKRRERKMIKEKKTFPIWFVKPIILFHFLENSWTLHPFFREKFFFPPFLTHSPIGFPSPSTFNHDPSLQKKNFRFYIKYILGRFTLSTVKTLCSEVEKTIFDEDNKILKIHGFPIIIKRIIKIYNRNLPD